MRLCVNWLPLSSALTRQVAERVEDAGLWGIGICDSPNYGELYAACRDALAATKRLVVSTSVTNPVTRHVSVHISAARMFTAAHPNRFRLGFGRGDSAVRTFGLSPASLKTLETTLVTIKEAAPQAPLLVAASGPAVAGLAGRISDGVIAGVGTDAGAIEMVKSRAAAAGAAAGLPAARPFEVWASVRLAVARDQDEVDQLRKRLLPRAISASHFAFASTLEGKNVPPEFADVLAERYRRYDYSWHGKSKSSPNAMLFADHPEIEEYLINRFAVYGTAEQCREKLIDLHSRVDGIYLSLLFEDALEQIPLISRIFDKDELTPAGEPGARRAACAPAQSR